MTKLTYGLIGHPVEHSLSPAMHNAAFKALKIDAEYKLFDVEPEGLEKFLKAMPGSGISGANVTIPHKVYAREYVEKNGFLDEHAVKLGAVNTIKVEEKRLFGFNTDGPGFYRSLTEDLRFDPREKTIFVLGAGGAARAIIMYLGEIPKKMYVTDIDDCKVAELKKHFEKYYSWHKLEVMKKGDFERDMGNADLFVQATPIGMEPGDPSPIDVGFLHPELCVYDLVYNRSTRLIQAAAERRLRVATGLGMLLYQGAIALEHWTGKKAPVDVMRKALNEGLKA